MLLQLRNIGMIQEADIKIDGLTVIAGENDTGKSTIGKALFLAIKSDMISLLKIRNRQATNFKANRINTCNRLLWYIFKNSICRVEDKTRVNGYLNLIDEGKLYYGIEFIYNEESGKDKCISFSGLSDNDFRRFKDAIIIQTPLILDLYRTFNSIAIYNQEKEFLGIATQIEYPFILWDLFTKLRLKAGISEEIVWNEVLGEEEPFKGDLIVDEQGHVAFKKDSMDTELDLEVLSTGIKSFLLLQMLLKNNIIIPERFFIFDEPEVHLHPKWQLLYAKLIVNLAQKGIKIIVTTHSPYFIEALQAYAILAVKQNQLHKDSINFYLAKDGFFYHNELFSLEKIYTKLSEPLDDIEKFVEENL